GRVVGDTAARKEVHAVAAATGAADGAVIDHSAGGVGNVDAANRTGDHPARLVGYGAAVREVHAVAGGTGDRAEIDHRGERAANDDAFGPPRDRAVIGPAAAGSAYGNAVVSGGDQPGRRPIIPIDQNAVAVMEIDADANRPG